jgi:hypothetical protein
VHLTQFQMVAAAIIGILSVARTARLIAHDSLPPVARLRVWWDDHVRGSWNPLIHCHFCLTPWMATGMAAWFWYSDAHWTWWVVNGIWGFSYVSAIVVSYDNVE